MRNLLDIRVILDACLDVRGEAGSATMICFHGDASSELFTGTILQGGVDTQIEYAGQKRVLSARYALEGTDYTGQKCRIFIQNEEKSHNYIYLCLPYSINDSRPYCMGNRKSPASWYRRKKLWNQRIYCRGIC